MQVAQEGQAEVSVSGMDDIKVAGWNGYEAFTAGISRRSAVVASPNCAPSR